MVVAVLGPGGVGGLLGALLARQGARVVFVARPATAHRLRADGVTVRSSRFGDFTVPAEAATVLPAGADAVLITVKAPDLVEALGAVPAAAVGEALLVPFLNGIDHVATLRQRYPAAAVVPATIRVEATRVAAGVVEHPSPFASMELASSAATAERVERLAAQLRSAGLDVTVRTDETAMLWEKLALLAPLALLTTLGAAPIGAVRAQLRDDLESCAREVAAVAAAQGVAVDPERLIATLNAVPAGMQSSMQRDAAAGRPLELDAIGGAILRAAEHAGIQVPVTARIVESLRQRK